MAYEVVVMNHTATLKPRVKPRAPRILLADDDLTARAAMAAQLAAEGYDVVQARDGEEALALLGSALVGELDPIDLVVSDDCMPGPTGVEVLDGIREASQTLPVILLTSYADPWLRSEARRLHATAVLEKPYAQDELCSAVARIVPTNTRSAR